MLSFNISSRTSDSRIGAKKNELLVLFLILCLKFVFWLLLIFLSRLLPTLLKKSLKASATLSHPLVGKIYCRSAFCTIKYRPKMFPQVFGWITPITQNLLIVGFFCIFDTLIQNFRYSMYLMELYIFGLTILLRYNLFLCIILVRTPFVFQC